jgi:hypothetical protein
MALTYDQKSEIRIAFEEAFIPAERRRDTRVRHRVDAQIAPWKREKQGEPFSVRIEDFSPGGVGLVHAEAMLPGNDYVLRVPRPDLPELILLLTVVRCVPQEDGTFLIGLELSTVMDQTSVGNLVDAMQPRGPRVSTRTKVLFVLFGIAGICLTFLF